MKTLETGSARSVRAACLELKTTFNTIIRYNKSDKLFRKRYKIIVEKQIEKSYKP